MQMNEAGKGCCGDCSSCLEPQSPCTRLCRLGKNSVCEGCFRTIKEIAAWSNMTPDEKAKTLVESAARRAESEAELVSL